MLTGAVFEKFIKICYRNIIQSKKNVAKVATILKE